MFMNEKCRLKPGKIVCENNNLILRSWMDVEGKKLVESLLSEHGGNLLAHRDVC